MTNSIETHSAPICVRCGTCCSKGGPALHRVDLDLVMTGAIELTDLFTIRTGETVINQIKGVQESAAEEIIKIKGAALHNWCCRYYDTHRHVCRIYAKRPLECRILKCWDTSGIEAVYQRERLNRRDLLETVPGLMELINFHAAQCDPVQIRSWIGDLAVQDGAIKQHAQKAIAESLHWDYRIRQQALEKANAVPEQMEFLFGRPLEKIIKIPKSDAFII